MQWWEDWGGLFLQSKPSQRRELNVAGEERLQARNQAKRTGIEETLCPLALRSPPIAKTTGIPRTPPSIKRRASSAPVILLPMIPDTWKVVKRLEREGLLRVRAYLSSADQTLFAVVR